MTSVHTFPSDMHVLHKFMLCMCVLSTLDEIVVQRERVRSSVSSQHRLEVRVQYACSICMMVINAGT